MAGQSGGASAVLVVMALVLGAYASAQHKAGDNQSFHREGLQEISRRACEVLHPVETLETPDGVQVCERQHLVRQAGDTCKADSNECDALTAYWSKSDHDYTDRQGESSPYAQDDPWFLSFTDDNRFNMEAAYKAGTYGLDWTVLLVNYNSKSTVAFAPMKFDGVSNLVYGISWLINVPQKFLHQVLYVIQIREPILLIDLLIGLVLLPLQIGLGVAATAAGLVGGSVLNPVDTILAIPGGIMLLVQTVIQAVWELLTCIPQAWDIVVMFAKLAWAAV